MLLVVECNNSGNISQETLCQEKIFLSKERVIMVHLHKTQGLTLWHLLKSKNESWGKSHFLTANDQPNTIHELQRRKQTNRKVAKNWGQMVEENRDIFSLL